MQNRRRQRVAAVCCAALLTTTGCGGSGNQESAEPTVLTADPTTTATPADDTTTSSSTTTEPVPPGPTPLPTDDIPALVVEWGDGASDPLELAMSIIGFPLAVPTPENTTPLHLAVDLTPNEDEAIWEWDWTYEVLSADPMPDIDIHAEEPSPGNVALRDFYDPIMTGLGWTYSNSTGSDPGGGPQSINHVYQSDADTLEINGFTATPKPLFVWADEEQVFGEGVPGYQVDVRFEFDAGDIPVPLIRAIVDAVPAPDDAELVDVRLLSWNRPTTSFDAGLGLRYFEVTLEWMLAPGTADAAKETFSTGLDSTLLFAGEESFFDPGFLEPTEPRTFDDDWTQPIVFLDRYEGSVDITGDDAAGAIVEVDIMFEPNRVVLAPAAE